MNSESSVRPDNPEKRKKKQTVLISLGAVICLAAVLLLPVRNQNYYGASMVPMSLPAGKKIGEFPLVIPTLKYGFALDTFAVEEGRVKANQTLSTLLASVGLDFPAIETLVKNCEGTFDYNRGLITGKTFTTLTKIGEERPSHLIYEPNVYHYIRFDLGGDYEVSKVEYPSETKLVSLAGSIESSLWAALIRQGVNLEAAAKMEDALQWSVDFSHALKGDEFRIVYDDIQIENKTVGSGRVYAAYYKRESKDYYAIWYENGTYKGYYDLEGRPTAKGFLKAPVKYTRISSKFSKSRLHPILRYRRPHLGTDYAAPHGTPIYAVGEGTVVEAGYSGGNGNYVRIKHDKIYQTQYLHMSRFAKGVRKGTHVSQGQVIGYVGSTGLATGPHVCFRFWKNGNQVNHLKLDLPKPKPLPQEILDDYFLVRDKYVKLLNGEQYLANEIAGPTTADKTIKTTEP